MTDHAMPPLMLWSDDCQRLILKEINDTFRLCYDVKVYQGLGFLRNYQLVCYGQAAGFGEAARFLHGERDIELLTTA